MLSVCAFVLSFLGGVGRAGSSWISRLEGQQVGEIVRGC